MTQVTGNYLIAFLVPSVADSSTLNFTILGFNNAYSTDTQTGGIQIQTTISGYLVDIINITLMSDQLTATSTNFSSFALNNYVVGQNTTLSLNLNILGYASQNNIVQITNISQSFYKSSDFQLLYNGNAVQSQSLTDQNQYLTSITFSLPSICQTVCTISLSNLINKDDTSPLNLYYTINIQTSTGGIVAFGNSQFLNQNVLQPPLIAVQYLNRSSELPAKNTQIRLAFTLPSFKNVPSNAVLNLIMPATDVNIATPNICSTDYPQQCLITQVNSSYIQLQVQNFCFNGCLGGQNLAINIKNGFINPPSIQATSQKYQLQLFSDSNSLMAQTTGGFYMLPNLQMNITMGQVSIISLVNQTVGSFTSLQINVVLAVALQQGTLIQVNLPAATFYTTNSISCQQYQCQNIATQTDQIGTYYMGFTILTTQAYDSGSTMMISLQNLMNKFDTLPVIQTQVQVTVQNAFGSATCQSSGYLNITYLPNYLGTLTATRSQLAVQQSTTIQLQVKLQTRLPLNSQMTISIPKSTFVQNQTQITTLNGAQIASSLSQNSTSYILNLNVQAQTDQAVLNATISGFANRYSTDSQSDGIWIQTSIGGYSVDIIAQTQLTDTLLPTVAIISSYSLSNTFVGQTTTLSLQLQMSAYAQQNDVLILKFLGQNNYVTNQVGANFNGQQVQCTSSQDENSYLTSITFQLPSKLLNQATIQIFGLSNRDTTQPVNFSFDVQLLSNAGGQIAVGESQFKNQSILQPTQFVINSLTRSSQIPGNQIQLSLNLSLPSVKNIPNDAQLLILVPSTEILIVASSSSYTNTQAICTFANFNSSFISLTLTNICNQGCKSGSNLQITIYSGILNQMNQLVTNSPYSFQITSNGYLIAQQVGGVVIQPPLIQSVTIQNLTLYQTSVTAADFTTFSMSFTLDYNVTQANLIQIGIPSQTFILDGKIVPQCLMYGQISTSCTIIQSQTFQDSPTFVTMIQFDISSGNFTAQVNQTIVMSGLRNTDIPRLRSNQNMFSLTIINNVGTIITSNLASESQLQDFTVATISNLNISRATVQTGQKGVNYQIQFQAQNYIRVGEYFQITLPPDQAQIDQSMLMCRETISGYNVVCQILQGQQILQVNQWCYIINNQKSQLCQPNVTMNLQVTLSNPSTFSAYKNPVTLNLFTQEAILKANNLTGAFVSPSLTGISLNNVSLQRINNTVGTRDTLQLTIGSLDTSIIVSTDLVLNLPDGTQFQSTQQSIMCGRNVSSKNSQLQCQVSKTFASGSIQQITIKNFCSQSLLCLKNQTFVVTIQNVLNPQTNQKISQRQLWIALQQGAIEVAISNITTSLAKMLPAQVYISTTVSNNCTTMTTCQLNVTLILTNSLQAGNFVTFVSPLSFQSLSCKTQSLLTSVNCIVVNTNSIKLLATSFVNNTTPLKFSIYSVSMPQTTASFTNFYATSYETLNGVSSMLDNATGGNITVAASQFTQLSVIRLKSTLGSTTDIQIQFANPQQVPNSQFIVSVPITQAILQSQSACFSLNTTVQCNVSQQTVTIKALRTFCFQSAQICKLTISNVMNPNGVFIGQGSQSFVQFQLLSSSAQNGTFYQILQSFQNVTPLLSQQNFTILNASIQPTNSFTAQPITISFQYTLQQGPGQFMQISFDKIGYQPIYSELQEVQVQINNQYVEIVNIQLTQTGWYWAPIQELTFSLPPNSFDQTSKVVLSGLSNPHMQNNQNNKAILNVMYLYSDLSALASTSIVIPVSMVPSLVNPITAYSTSPYVATQTFIDVSFGLQNNSAYLGNIQFQLPQAFQLQKSPNCSELLTQKNISCFAQTQSSVVIPFNQTQSYTGFSFRIGPITNPVNESTGQVKIQIYDSQGTYSQGSFELSAYTQGQTCSENCQKCTSSGICTNCSQGFVLNGDLCTLVCPLGQFALQSYCYQCQTQCLACQRQDQCSVCNSDQVILSGLCLSSCPNGYASDNQSQCQLSNKSSQSSCDSSTRQIYTQNTVNDAGSTKNTNITFALQQAGINQTTNPFFFCQNALSQSACDVKNCSNCGLVSSVCQVCANNMVILDGACVINCPSGYFLFDKQCYKCSSACQNCQGTASNCTDCKDGLLYSPKYGQCKKGCSSGYYYQQSNKSCISCDSKCNTCDIQATNCTSCLMDMQTSADMFLIKGTCVTQCPSLQFGDLATHKCISPVLTASSLTWCLPLCFVALIVSFGCPTIVKGKTSYLSLNTIQVATAFITTFDFLNKLGLIISLWPSQNLGSFVVIGINILLTSLLGIYESHIVQFSGRPHLLKIISQIAGPQLTRLLLSNFLALFKINLPTSLQPVANSQEYERCCLCQSILVVIQMLNSVAIVAMSSPQQYQFGLAVNSLILGSVSLSLHALIIRNSRVAPILAKQVAA